MLFTLLQDSIYVPWKAHVCSTQSLSISLTSALKQSQRWSDWRKTFPILSWKIVRRFHFYVSLLQAIDDVMAMRKTGTHNNKWSRSGGGRGGGGRRGDAEKEWEWERESVKSTNPQQEVWWRDFLVCRESCTPSIHRPSRSSPRWPPLVAHPHPSSCTQCTNITQTIHRHCTHCTHHTQPLHKLYTSHTHTAQTVHKPHIDTAQTAHKPHTNTVHKPYTDIAQTVHKWYTDTAQTVHKHCTNPAQTYTNHKQIVHKTLHSKAQHALSLASARLLSLFLPPPPLLPQSPHLSLSLSCAIWVFSHIIFITSHLLHITVMSTFFQALGKKTTQPNRR